MSEETTEMNFSVKQLNKSMRIGELMLGTYKASTPSVLVSTSRLAVPHTTLERFRKMVQPGANARIAGVISYTDKMFENPKLVKSDNLSTIQKFGSLQDFPVFLGLESGLDAGVEKLNNGKEFVTVSNTSGACKVMIKDMAELCNKLQPDAMVYPHARIFVSTPEKHLNRASQRTAEYIKIFSEHFKASSKMMEPMLRGDSSMSVWGRMFVNLDESNVEARLAELKDSEGLRYAAGMFSPMQVVQLVRAGIDLVDTSYVDYVTNQLQALVIDFTPENLGEFKLIPLEKEDYFEEISVINEDCGCLACADSVTKSYIHHLIKTHELLATVHLQAHNLHQYIKLLEALRA